MNLGICIEAGIVNYGNLEIQIERSGDSRKDNAAGGNAEKNQIFNAARAKRQV
jgi:hypothetical protein